MCEKLKKTNESYKEKIENKLVPHREKWTKRRQEWIARAAFSDFIRKNLEKYPYDKKETSFWLEDFGDNFGDSLNFFVANLSNNTAFSLSVETVLKKILKTSEIYDDKKLITKYYA